mmetsp:Transcript_4348/g.14445  ORF Transcript_4348/g.14445 Transcript_4348/m.14445 type:complete len:417 (+) Transcript_4348:69-1319(+)
MCGAPMRGGGAARLLLCERVPPRLAQHHRGRLGQVEPDAALERHEQHRRATRRTKRVDLPLALRHRLAAVHARSAEAASAEQRLQQVQEGGVGGEDEGLCGRVLLAHPPHLLQAQHHLCRRLGRFRAGGSLGLLLALPESERHLPRRVGKGGKLAEREEGVGAERLAAERARRLLDGVRAQLSEALVAVGVGAVGERARVHLQPLHADRAVVLLPHPLAAALRHRSGTSDHRRRRRRSGGSLVLCEGRRGQLRRVGRLAQPAEQREDAHVICLHGASPQEAVEDDLRLALQRGVHLRLVGRAEGRGAPRAELRRQREDRLAVEGVRLAPAQHQRVEQRAQPVGVAGECLVRRERLAVLWQPQEAEEGEEVVGRVLDGRAGQAPAVVGGELCAGSRRGGRGVAYRVRLVECHSPPAE